MTDTLLCCQAMRFDLTLNQRRGVWAGMLNILTDTQKAQVNPSNSPTQQ